MIPLFDPNGGPLYGLSANVAPSPLAAVLSVAMILGVDSVGLLALRGLRLSDFAKHPWLRWQASAVGAALLAALLYPAALAGGFPRSFARVLAAGIVVVGLARSCGLALQGASRAASLIRQPPRIETSSVLIWLIVAGLGLLALGPVTEADSLDYHLGVAMSILNTGAFPFSPEWFTSRLAGSGEVLIALGLAIGAEQFGSLLQYSAVIAIVGVFRHGLMATRLPEPAGRWRKIVTLAAVSSPVFLAWVASPKPMLLPAAMTTAALTLAVTFLAGGRERASPLQQRNAFALVCLLVMAAAVMKMNFLMSGAIVGFLALGYMIRNRQIAPALVLGIAGALLIVAPPVAWKHEHYGGALIDALVTPFPGHWPGTREFEAMLRAYRDTQVPFPLSLVVPAGLGTVTTVLGLGLLLPMVSMAQFRAGDSETKVFVLAAIAVAALGTILGQRNARFFLEPYLWLLIATSLVPAPSGKGAIRWISRAVAVQSILALAMIGIGVVTLTPGALTPALRENTMDRHAYGYSAMKWADSVLPRDARVVVEPRSIALMPRFAISNDWRGYIASGSDEAQPYTDAVSRQRPDFTLVQLPAGGRLRSDMGCENEVYAGPFRVRGATRNPFNLQGEYDVWITWFGQSEPAKCLDSSR